MNATAKLAGFAAVAAVAFGAAAAVGSAVGPIEVGADASHDAPGDLTAGAVELPGGLAVAQAGHRLVLDADSVGASEPTVFGFEILDPSGAPLTEYDELHERPLHLTVVSRTLVEYHHLHPSLERSGHWTVELPALPAGWYRVLADFRPTGSEAGLTLGADLAVDGVLHDVPLPVPASAMDVDGYTVTFDGAPAVGASALTFEVRSRGELVRTDPYLGAAGHLVAIRDGDLAYLHVHPHEGDRSAAVTFTAEFPTAGAYRLFFDFSVGGVVRTAAFTVVVGDSAAPPAPAHEQGH